MRASYTCPNCGVKKIVNINVPILILVSITIIGIIPWMIWFFKQVKCQKCKCMMEPTRTIQQIKDTEPAPEPQKKKNKK